MSVTIHGVLDGLRESALDERDKGDRFERLVLNFLRTDLRLFAGHVDPPVATRVPKMLVATAAGRSSDRVPNTTRGRGL